MAQVVVNCIFGATRRLMRDIGTGSVTGKVASILRSPSSSSTGPMNDARDQNGSNTAYTEGTSPEAAIDPLSQVRTRNITGWLGRGI